MSYDYEKYIKDNDPLLREMEGAVLISILVNIVDPEFNIVYLQMSSGIFSVHGRIGGEYLGLHRLSEMPCATSPSDDVIICRYPPYDIFEGCTLSQARQMGSAWHGHGFEFSFSERPTRSMIVQTIYCGAESKGQNDCLRLGIGCYENEWVKT
jgi:hypothetical protein